MSDGFHANDRGGVFDTPGIDWGYRCRPGPKVVHRNGEYVVYKVTGCTAWASVGNQEYYKTYYVLAHVEPRPTSERPLRVYVHDLSDRVEPGRRWRGPVQVLRDKADALAQAHA